MKLISHSLKISVLLAVFFFELSTYGQVNLGPYCGAVTDNSVVIVYQMESGNIDIQIVYSTNENLNNPIQTDSFSSSAAENYIVKVPLENLESDTRYHYAPMINGRILTKYKGTFRTFFKEAGDFSIAFGNSLKDCRPAESGMLAALENDPLFFLNTGDLFYNNIGENDLALFRNAYEDALKRTCDSRLGASVPLVYIWDDHDYGPNNSDATALGREASRYAYREYIPHYPLPAGNGNFAIYQAFSVGAVRFILTDLRSERYPSKGTMMGQKQLEWFLHELSDASNSHELIIWVSSVPYTTTQNASSDNWGGFEEERRTIANHIKEENIANMMIVSGDAHSLAAGDGSDADYADGGGAPLAEVLAAPLDGDPTSIKGGPWNQGTYCAPVGENAYGLLSVSFTESEIRVNFSGRTNTHEEKISLYKIFYRKASR